MKLPEADARKIYDGIKIAPQGDGENDWYDRLNRWEYFKENGDYVAKAIRTWHKDL